MSLLSVLLNSLRLNLFRFKITHSFSNIGICLFYSQSKRNLKRRSWNYKPDVFFVFIYIYVGRLGDDPSFVTNDSFFDREESSPPTDESLYRRSHFFISFLSGTKPLYYGGSFCFPFHGCKCDFPRNQDLICLLSCFPS